MIFSSPKFPRTLIHAIHHLSDPGWDRVDNDKKICWTPEIFAKFSATDTNFGQTCGRIYVLRNNLRINIEREQDGHECVLGICVLQQAKIITMQIRGR